MDEVRRLKMTMAIVPFVSQANIPASLSPQPPKPTLTMNPLHENGGPHSAAPLPEPSLPAPQRDWRNMTRTIAHYERIEQIGEGTYGQVYRARCKDTNQIVALKKIRVHHGGYWGMPPTVIREIKILKRLRHPSLVQMVEVVSSKGVEHLDEEDEVEEKHKLSKKDRIIDAREGYKGNLFLVLEYVAHDLTGLMDVAYRFSEVQVKCVFKQLLEALEYMHDNKYVHRDIKSSNILIDHNFRVKLADFGLARCIEPPILDRIHDRGNSQEFTNKVITLWYRPPELLLGATRYGTAVDIWSTGCILAELILGKPLFTGKSEMEQLQLIFEMLGTPTPETWEGFQDLKLLRTGEVTIEERRRAKLRDKYQSKMSAPALNLVEKLLELDPHKRLTASRALNSRYFMSEPRAPDQPEDLGPLQVEGGHFHEFQTKKKRREAKGIAEKTRQNALEVGRSEKEAQAEFDATYRGIMEKVAKEGLNAGPKVEKKDSGFKRFKESGDGEEKSQRDKSERKRSKGEREKDRESRREKRSRDEKKKEGKRESRENDRDKEKASRRPSESEGRKGDDDKRRKRRRDEEGKRESDSKKRDKANRDESKHGGEQRAGEASRKREEQVKVDKGEELKPETPLVGDKTSAKPDYEAPVQQGAGIEGKVSTPVADKKDGDEEKERSSRKRRDRSRDRRSSRSSRDGERRKSRDHDRDRDKDRDRRRRSDERERDRKRDRGSRDRDWDRDRGEADLGRDRDPDWSRRDRDRDRGARDRRSPPRNGPPRGEYDHRDDFGPRGGPYGPPRGGPPPDFRGGPPRGDMGAYGPASGDFRGPPPGGQGPPPGYYDDQRRRERDRSPRRDRGRDRR